jgi:Zn-dependent peptidase ImmA (M78 family)
MNSEINEKVYVVEAEANVFARHLLMPEKHMQKLLDEFFHDQYGNNYDYPVLYENILNKVIELFQVPKEQAIIRLIDFGLISKKHTTIRSK